MGENLCKPNGNFSRIVGKYERMLDQCELKQAMDVANWGANAKWWVSKQKHHLWMQEYDILTPHTQYGAVKSMFAM
jgi:hypothetical protein